MNNEERILSILESMQADISGLKTDVAYLKAGQAKLETDMDTGFATLGGQIIKMDERLTRVEETVTRIENDHGAKLDALADGHFQNVQALERIEKEVSKHEEVILRKVF